MKSFNLSIFQSFNRNNGQVMLLTVLILGGTILTASTIAGYLMTLKIRASLDIANSAKAIFAADTGIEWELYKCFKCNPNFVCDPDCPADFDSKKPSMTNNSSFESLVDVSNMHIKSIGKVFGNFRAFEIEF